MKNVTFRIRLLHFALKVITDISVLYHIFCYISRYKCLALFCTFCGATKLTFLLDFILHGSNEEESFMDHPKGRQYLEIKSEQSILKPLKEAVSRNLSKFKPWELSPN